jgi:serine/threonine-protein kinase
MHTPTGNRPAPASLGPRYALLRLLRPEPWGDVWLAQDRFLHVEVAVKFMPREAPEFLLARDFLMEEGRLALRLRHPRILAGFYAGELEEGVFLVLEPFAGESLLSRLTRLPRLVLSQALHFLEQAGQALAAAHSQGIVHQGLTPVSVLVEGERLKVANFAFPPRQEEDLSHLELKAYVAPEVLRGEEVTPAANIFSLGVLGFRLCVGSLPYPLTFDEPFPYRLEMPPADLAELPVPLQNLFLRCLAPAPEDRLPDGEAFLNALAQARELWRAAPREERRGWETPESRATALTAARKLWEEGKAWGSRLGEGLRPVATRARQAPRRLWYGLGLGLLAVLVLWGGSRLLWTSRPAAPPPPEVPAAPVRPPEVAGPPRGAPPAPRPPETPPAPSPAAPPAAGSPAREERFILLVASYGKYEQARAVAEKLKARQLPARVMRTTPGGKPVFQVRLGPYTQRAAAEEAARKLKAEGFTPKLARLNPETAGPAPAGRIRR